MLAVRLAGHRYCWLPPLTVRDGGVAAISMAVG